MNRSLRMSTLRFRKVRLCVVLSVAIFWGCSKPQPVEPQVGEDVAPGDRAADDTARFLAGLPGRNGSPFAALEATPAWRRHRREIEGLWNPVERQWLPKMREFRAAELSSIEKKNPVVFYPFSGPDVLAVNAFFPNAQIYVLAGLEPSGTLPSPKQIEKRELDPYLSGIRESIYSELHRSFFITREMDSDFRGQATDGLLQPILMLLALTNHTILDARYVRIDEQGRIAGRAPNYKAPGKIGNKGVAVSFRGGDRGPRQVLYYFTVNLSDERLKINPQFLRYLQSLGSVATFLKATSYMPHHEGFGIIREEILSRSAAILQDDSGIPFRYFQQPQWVVQLYGQYDRPYGSFRYLEQPALRAAYAAPGVKPLTFRIGYGFGKVPSNLLLATRRETIAAAGH